MSAPLAAPVGGGARRAQRALMPTPKCPIPFAAGYNAARCADNIQLFSIRLSLLPNIR